MRRLIILHVEDHADAAFLLARACSAAKLEADFHHVNGVSEAIDYMNGTGRFVDRGTHPAPDVVILDIQMAGGEGLGFLRWIRTDQRFSQLPVLVFTQSRSLQDRERAIAGGATGYFVKPVAFDALVKLAESMNRFRNVVDN